jgi:hypothetical protein
MPKTCNAELILRQMPKAGVEDRIGLVHPSAFEISTLCRYRGIAQE